MQTKILLLAVLLVGAATTLTPAASASECHIEPIAALECTVHAAEKCVHTLVGIARFGVGGEAQFC